MVPQYGKEKGTKTTLGLWCKSSIRGDANELLFTKQWDVEITLTNITDKNFNISEYLYFGFYEKLFFKDNDVLSPIEPGR